MIQNYFDNVKRFLGSLISNARAREGWGKGIYLFLRRFLRSKKQNSAAANARAGRAFLFPVPLFLPAPPERWVVGGSAARSAALKVSIWIFAEKGSDFVQYAEPFRTRQGKRLAASPLGAPICQYFPRHFGDHKNFPLPQNAVRRAKHGANGNLQPILFLPPKAESKAIIYPPKADCPKAI
jgi:hypothetical protein